MTVWSAAPDFTSVENAHACPDGPSRVVQVYLPYSARDIGPGRRRLAEAACSVQYDRHDLRCPPRCCTTTRSRSVTCLENPRISSCTPGTRHGTMQSCNDGFQAAGRTMVSYSLRLLSYSECKVFHARSGSRHRETQIAETLMACTIVAA